MTVFLISLDKTQTVEKKLVFVGICDFSKDQILFCDQFMQKTTKQCITFS